MRSKHCARILCLVVFAALGASPASVESQLVRRTVIRPARPAYQLFNGHDLAGWSKFNDSPVEKGWTAENGVLRRSGPGGDIYFSFCEFDNFDLSWEWKIAPGGNSGVKYKVANFDGRWLGCEYQLLDDQSHRDGTRPETSTGALYDLAAPCSEKRLKSVGEFNHSRVVVCGHRVQHWLNGDLLLEVDLCSADWRQRVAESKFAEVAGFAANRRGYIMFQDHGGEVWFRNVYLQRL